MQALGHHEMCIELKSTSFDLRPVTQTIGILAAQVSNFFVIARRTSMTTAMMRGAVQGGRNRWKLLT
jgi:hypothetical protein